MEGLARPMTKARATNATNTTFPARIPQSAEPKTDGTGATSTSVIELANEGGGGVIPWGIRLVLFGVGSDNDAFDCKVSGIFRLGSDPLDLWVYTTLATIRGTLGTSVGVAGTPMTASERFADTLSVIAEATVTADVTRGGTLELFSPADNSIAWVEVPLRGCEKVELTFADNVNTPTKNALYSLLG